MPQVVLYAEDSNDDAFFLQKVFNQFPRFTLDWVIDGEQVLAYLKARPAPALLILDIKMPRLNGLETLAQLRADPTYKALPIIILSSSREQRDIEAAAKHGANAFFCKPSHSRDLPTLISAVLSALPKFTTSMRWPIPGNLLFS